MAPTTSQGSASVPGTSFNAPTDSNPPASEQPTTDPHPFTDAHPTTDAHAPTLAQFIATYITDLRLSNLSSPNQLTHEQLLVQLVAARDVLSEVIRNWDGADYFACTNADEVGRADELNAVINDVLAEALGVTEEFEEVKQERIRGKQPMKQEQTREQKPLKHEMKREQQSVIQEQSRDQEPVKREPRGKQQKRQEWKCEGGHVSREMDRGGEYISREMKREDAYARLEMNRAKEPVNNETRQERPAKRGKRGEEGVLADVTEFFQRKRMEGEQCMEGTTGDARRRERTLAEQGVKTCDFAAKRGEKRKRESGE
ncbi:hypothetical protein MMC30_001303 [Trapelia coarctata]|nr:hypothetical protein [Trapelia coarctata]